MTSPGLRERKKQKTRWAIQEHALRLIAEQGYDATTVDQIAAAAEISPSTFFRYFPTKEDLIVEDEYDALLVEGMSTMDPAMPPLDAIRQVMRSTLAVMTEADKTKLLERTRLILAVPALRARSLENFSTTVGLISDLVARRTGLAGDSVEVRVFAGAVIGALTSVIEIWIAADGAPDVAGLIDRAMELVGAGLPLPAPPPAS
jgi:AcrR family transcriptional regulator